MTVAILFAVHIADGVLSWPWCLGGFAVALGLVFLASRHIAEQEIARVSLLTAAFFVASSIHVPAGPTSVHLILNGLVGVLLGLRAALAIAIGLALQAALLHHGGFGTLGVNTCILTLPALLAGITFRWLHQVRWAKHPAGRYLLVSSSVLIWILVTVFAICSALPGWSMEAAWRWATSTGVLLAAGAVAAIGAFAESRLERVPELPIGLLLGIATILSTTALNAAVLAFGGMESWDRLAKLVFLAHLPIAAIEAVVLGLILSFLSRARPELLNARLNSQDEAEPHLPSSPPTDQSPPAR